MWSKLQGRSKQGSWPYPNQDQNVKPQSETLGTLKRHKLGLKDHGYYLHLQNQDRETKFWEWVY